MPKSNYKIPFDKKTGNLVSYVTSYNESQYDFKDNFVFETTLTFLYFSRGRSAAHAVFENHKNQCFDMFLTDLSEALRNKTIINGKISGLFTFVKRGSNYGVKIVSLNNKTQSEEDESSDMDNDDDLTI